MRRVGDEEERGKRKPSAGLEHRNEDKAKQRAGAGDRRRAARESALDIENRINGPNGATKAVRVYRWVKRQSNKGKPARKRGDRLKKTAENFHQRRRLLSYNVRRDGRRSRDKGGKGEGEACWWRVLAQTARRPANGHSRHSRARARGSGRGAAEP